MALIDRVSRLFKADFHAVLDRIEEPEQLLRQAIRDMEDELSLCRRRIAACAQEQECLQARRSEIQGTSAEYDSQLDLCFESGNEELARNIVRRKLESERLLRRLDGRLEANARFLRQQRQSLDDNRATLEGLRQKAELIVADAHVDATNPEFDGFARAERGVRIADDEVEIAWLREKAARSRS